MLKYVAPLEQQLRHLSARIPKHGKPTAVGVDGETTGQRLAEHAAASIGSWAFIGAQTCLIVGWILWNTLGPGGQWDRYPFIVLNLFMSAEAALTGPILLIAANVGAIRDHKQYDRMEGLERRAEDMEENILARLDTLSKRLNTIAPPPAAALPTPAPKPAPRPRKKVSA